MSQARLYLKVWTFLHGSQDSISVHMYNGAQKVIGNTMMLQRERKPRNLIKTGMKFSPWVTRCRDWDDVSSASSACDMIPMHLRKWSATGSRHAEWSVLTDCVGGAASGICR